MSEKVKCPECGTVVQGGGIVKCPKCSMTFCAKCKEQLQQGDQVCPHCGNKKEQPKPEQKPELKPAPKPEQKTVPKKESEHSHIPVHREPKPASGISIKISDLAKELGIEPRFISGYLYSEGYGSYLPDDKIHQSIADEVRAYFKNENSRDVYDPSKYTDKKWPEATPATQKKQSENGWWEKFKKAVMFWK